jgi:hypothetical protein
MASSSGIPGISIIPASGLTTQTFDGMPGGMNLALPAQEIDDTEARYLQDVLVDRPGLTRRRGPVVAVSGLAVLPRKGSALIAALNPTGASRFGVLTGDNSNGYLTVYDSTLSTTVDLAWPHPLPTNPGGGASYRLIDAKPAMRGGAWIGVSSAYDAAAPNQALGLWYGGTKANATITVTGTRGSTTVTGTGFTAGVDTGMFLFADTDDPYTQAYIGVVKSVDSNTSLTLVAVSGYTITARTGTFQSLRGLAPKVAKGHLTTDVAAATVTGGSTKFRSQKLDAGTVLNGTPTNASAVITGISSTTGLTKGMPVTGTNIGAAARILSVDSSTQVTLTVVSTGSPGSVALTFKVPWDLYRASDMTWIGTVLSVQSEVGLTLLANAAISLADEAYVAVRADANFSLITTGTTQKVGFISANYADRQWYFNNGADFAKTSRGWFSDTADPEIIDMSDFDGDWIDVVSTSNVNEPIRGAQAAYNGLLMFKETETFIVGGSSPSSFNVRKLEDDGAISGGSIQAYAGGVIWAGREGIHFYDGIQAQNLTAAKLGDYWRNTMRTFDPTKYRMWSMVDRDHYMLFIESIAPTVAVVKGNVSTTPTKYTIAINMISRAVTTFTNLDIRGSASIPGSAGRTMWYLVNDSSKAIICDGEALFNQEGVDSIVCDGSAAAGPDFYVESKKYDAGDGLRLKRFKLLMVWYLAQGDLMKVDVVLGLNDIGQTLTGNFPVSGFTWDTLRGQIGTWDALKAQFATWSAVVQSVFVPKRVRFQKKNQYMAFRLYQNSASVTRMQIGPFQLGYKLQRAGRL